MIVTLHCVHLLVVCMHLSIHAVVFSEMADALTAALANRPTNYRVSDDPSLELLRWQCARGHDVLFNVRLNRPQLRTRFQSEALTSARR